MELLMNVMLGLDNYSLRELKEKHHEQTTSTKFFL